LYEDVSAHKLTEGGMQVVQSLGITSIMLGGIYLVWPAAMIGRWVFLCSVIVLAVLLMLWRALFGHVICERLLSQRTVIVGSGGLAEDILREIGGRRDSGFDIRYIIAEVGEEKKFEELGFSGLGIRYGFERLWEFVKMEKISNIIVALDQRRGVLPYRELLECKVRGVYVVDGESFYEKASGKVLVEKINPSWLIFSDGFVKSQTFKMVNRVAGLIFSGIMLALLSPVLVMIAVLIKMDSPGPVIFSQDRVGENEKRFRLFKFRSMKADAEKECGPVWAIENDPRVTRVGKIIRRLRIDELPQLWNIVKGDMSFVGPRPERSFFVEKLKRKIPYYNERFSVKPGVTGWAQIKYPYGASEEDAKEKLKYDLFYIKNMSVVMDVIVILHTMKIMLLGRGAR
jgi:sugar transferase (PEP-CTERM system associated)